MNRPAALLFKALILMMSCSAAGASGMVCTHPTDRNLSFTVVQERGVYTWDDHGIRRSWELTCDGRQGTLATCHRWEVTGQKGRSVMIFRMLPDGSLVEAGAWALLDTSTARVTPGFACEISAD